MMDVGETSAGAGAGASSSSSVSSRDFKCQLPCVATMATALSLLDAGVPLRDLVAAVSVRGENSTVLTYAQTVRGKQACLVDMKEKDTHGRDLNKDGWRNGKALIREASEMCDIIGTQLEANIAQYCVQSAASAVLAK